MPTRSPRRNRRSRGRAGRTFYGTSGGGGGGTFDPSTISGKLLWLRGKDLGTLNSSITSWTDQSGAGVTIAGTSAVVCDSTPLAITAATASTESGAGNNAAKATDGNSGTGWITSTGNATGWLRAQMPSAVIATGYMLTSFNATRMANAWTFEGSNDGSAWTTLDTRTGETAWSTGTRFYQFTNTTAYLYYRLNVSANNGDTLLSVAEMSVHVKTLSKGALFNNGRLDTTSLSTTGTTREVWIVANSQRFGTRLSSWGSAGTGLYPNSDLKVYDDTFIATRQSFTYTLTPLQAQRLVRITMTGGVWTYYLDNVQQATFSAQTFAQGLRRPIDGLFGTAHEILELNAISDSTQTANLISYFNTEHGLTVT